MHVGTQRDLTDATGELIESRIPTQIEAQRQRVGKEPDQVLQLGAPAVGDG